MLLLIVSMEIIIVPIGNGQSLTDFINLHSTVNPKKDSYHGIVGKTSCRI